MDQVRLLKFPVFDDARGRVMPVEHASRDLPFVPARTFIICDVPPGQVRAQHTLTCHQILVLTTGSLDVVVRERGGDVTHPLREPGSALFIPEGRWIALREFAKGTVLLVLAAKPYTPRN